MSMGKKYLYYVCCHKSEIRYNLFINDFEINPETLTRIFIYYVYLVVSTNKYNRYIIIILIILLFCTYI